MDPTAHPVSGQVLEFQCLPERIFGRGCFSYRVRDYVLNPRSFYTTRADVRLTAFGVPPLEPFQSIFRCSCSRTCRWMRKLLNSRKSTLAPNKPSPCAELRIAWPMLSWTLAVKYFVTNDRAFEGWTLSRLRNFVLHPNKRQHKRSV